MPHILLEKQMVTKVARMCNMLHVLIRYIHIREISRKAYAMGLSETYIPVMIYRSCLSSF